MVNYIVGRWATKYKYLPDDIRFEGSCEERIQHLKARGYGLYSNIPPHRGIVWWQQNCSRLEAESRKVNEIGYIVEQVEHNVVTTLEHNAAVRRQQQANADNATQSAAFWALRGGGKAEAAAQMANPISTQTFNTKQGTYVVEGRSTSNDNRAAAEAETLRIALKKNAALKAKQQTLSQWDSMISTSSNSSVMPSSDAQNQFGPQLPFTSYIGSLESVSKNLVSNNNVNPLSLYGPQPVNTNGQGKNSSVNSNSIVTNANYNYATDMNNFQTANPSSDINMDIGGEKYVFTDKSTAPKSNEVETSLLGGDIQHQETDLTTNMESTPQLANQDESNVDFDGPGPIKEFGNKMLVTLSAIGIAGLVLSRSGKKRVKV